MSYFGLLTCGGCGQKVSIEPKQVISESSHYSYFCRRCQKHFDIPQGLVFKHPTKKDLSVREAFKKSGLNPNFISKLKKILGLGRN